MQLKILPIFLSLIFLFSCNPTTIKKEYWDNGKVKLEFEYKGSSRNGLQKEYNEKGVLIRKYNYTNDTINGLCIEFYDNGVPKNLFKYKNGKINGTCYTLNESKKLDEIKTYQNDTLLGPIINYYPSGRIRYKCQYCIVFGFGEINDSNTIIKANHLTQKESVFCGEFIGYHDNGSISVLGYYYPGYLLKENSEGGGIYRTYLPVKDSVWKYYDVNKQLILTEQYKKGALIPPR